MPPRSSTWPSTWAPATYCMPGPRPAPQHCPMAAMCCPVPSSQRLVACCPQWLAPCRACHPCSLPTQHPCRGTPPTGSSPTCWTARRTRSSGHLLHKRQAQAGNVGSSRGKPSSNRLTSSDSSSSSSRRFSIALECGQCSCQHRHQQHQLSDGRSLCCTMDHGLVVGGRIWRWCLYAAATEVRADEAAALVDH